MRRLTTNLKILAKQAAKTSRKLSRKLKTGLKSSKQQTISQMRLSQNLTISEISMGLISPTLFVTKVPVDLAIQCLSLKSLSPGSSYDMAKRHQFYLHNTS
jgi:hypothetical protein